MHTPIELAQFASAGGFGVLRIGFLLTIVGLIILVRLPAKARQREGKR
ncbi:MAG: hypothetical protein WCT12_08260 [Verrucomicrobiota bacterium]